MDNMERFDDDNFYIHVGNERHVTFVDNLWEIDIMKEGRRHGYDQRYMDERGGCSVMFVQEESDGNVSARSFEIQIDKEIFGCGTGAVATALMHDFRKPWEKGVKGKRTEVRFKGGTVEVMFDRVEAKRYENVYLIGPAKKSYEGYINMEDYHMQPEYSFK